tara:strand:+ start:621 stop:725 length:105 start_codon:yes stop_codon:yes gene_type:complete
MAVMEKNQTRKAEESTNLAANVQLAFHMTLSLQG